MSTIIPIVIGVVRNSNGHILLGRRIEPETPEIHDKWNLLGGRIDFGESPEETIVREIKEESGLDIEVIRMLPQVATRFRTKTDGSQYQVLALSFECLVAGGEMDESFSDPGVSTLKFFHPQELPFHNLMAGDDIIIQLALEK